jgi:glycerol kinase
VKVVLALDLGTTGNRAIAFSKDGQVVAQAYEAFPQIFPKPGWVEHDPNKIWETTLRTLKKVILRCGLKNIVAIGITNQRETTLLWDKKTGKPIYNAIVWQDRRTASVCDKLSNLATFIRRKTGLSLDPYFSATKIHWILKNTSGVRKQAEKGNVLFGTIDSWILWNLTGGRVHATDSSNASRTMLYNIQTLNYDEELLKIFDVPMQILPHVKESAGKFGYTSSNLLGREIPISGILGDQQAALFAQGGWEKGVVKNTYGTGLFLMTTTGSHVPHSGRLINTVAWTLNGKTTYALEGSVFVGGSCIQWLRDGLKMIRSASETKKIAETLHSNEGVYLVPALVGLGAPYWDPLARGMIIGMTRGTTAKHFVRAALESMAYQTRDVVDEMKKVHRTPFKKLRVDGGAVKNNFLMQFQSDILNMIVERPGMIETTALGAAGIAGISSGFWTKERFLESQKVDKVFRPKMSRKQRETYYGHWKEAVKRALKWGER